jgi:hypothetical protein
MWFWRTKSRYSHDDSIARSGWNEDLIRQVLTSNICFLLRSFRWEGSFGAPLSGPPQHKITKLEFLGCVGESVCPAQNPIVGRVTFETLNEFALRGIKNADSLHHEVKGYVYFQERDNLGAGRTPYLEARIHAPPEAEHHLVEMMALSRTFGNPALPVFIDIEMSDNENSGDPARVLASMREPTDENWYSGKFAIKECSWLFDAHLMRGAVPNPLGWGFDPRQPPLKI